MIGGIPLSLWSVITLIAIALPILAFGAGGWLIWTGVAGKSWWPMRLIAGAPLTAYGAFGIVYMTL